MGDGATCSTQAAKANPVLFPSRPLLGGDQVDTWTWIRNGTLGNFPEFDLLEDEVSQSDTRNGFAAPKSARRTFSIGPKLARTVEL
jgi:hypothetical protein